MYNVIVPTKDISLDKNKYRIKSKGFTLIELLVVISIIALLSSVVIASLKSAREKAEGTKTVSEMKSLQTAFELYRGKFGMYPNVYADESGPSFNNFVKTYLVDNKYISNIPKTKDYPNNCINGVTNCYYGNMFFYAPGSDFIGWGNPSDSNYGYYMCGDKRITQSNYVLGYISNKKLNLPSFLAYDFYPSQENPEDITVWIYPGLTGGDYSNNDFSIGDANLYGAYEYCLTF